MTYHTRAALAGLTALALSACITTDTIIAAKAPSAEVDVSEMSKIEMPDADMKDMGESMAEAAADGAKNIEASKENLLYGAMTKYELMSFLEAINAADMQSALEGEAPVTVFAPNNQAFEYASLGDEADMPAILKGHIVDGAMDVAALKAAVAENGAPVELTSSAGTPLTVYVMDDKVKIAGPSGALATITQGDMRQSNGVMHQISSVFLPK